MEKWVIAAKRADFNQIGQQFHIDPVIARLIRNRDVIGEDKIREYLSGTVQELPSPWLMKDMEKAVDILEKKISQKAKVRIIGDYDIDGVTSTYILMKGLARIVPEYGSSDDQWSKLAALDYDLNNNNWITVGTGDPLAYMANWATDTSYCAYSNPDYDKLYEELKGEMDPEKRKDLIFQMQQILVDDAAVLIDGYYNSSMIYSKKVGSAHIHTADYYWLSTEITPAE